MNLITWVVFGIILGSLANIWDSNKNLNQVLGTFFFAITGALLGGVLSNIFLGVSLESFSFMALIIAVGVSVLLVMTGASMRRLAR